MAKTRKKKKTGTSDAIHIDINSHNAKDHAKYRMMEEKIVHLKKSDLIDGCKFSLYGIDYTYHARPYGDVIHYNGKFAAKVISISSTSMNVTTFFFNKRVKTTLKFKDLYFVA